MLIPVCLVGYRRGAPLENPMANNVTRNTVTTLSYNGQGPPHLQHTYTFLTLRERALVIKQFSVTG